MNTTRGASSGKLLHGKYQESYFDGSVKNTGHFNHGLKTGNWSFYSQDGNLLSSLKYKKGDTISPVLFYNNSGIVTDTILSAKALKKQAKKDDKKKEKKSPRKKFKFKGLKKDSSTVAPKDSI